MAKTLEERLEALKSRAGKVSGAVLPTTLEKAEARLRELRAECPPDLEEKVREVAKALAASGIDPSKDGDFGSMYNHVRRLDAARERVSKARIAFDTRKAKNEARAAKLATIFAILER